MAIMDNKRVRAQQRTRS